jgi:hypothetical protein
MNHAYREDGLLTARETTCGTRGALALNARGRRPLIALCLARIVACGPYCRVPVSRDAFINLLKVVNSVILGIY